MAGAMGTSPDRVESAAGLLLGHAHYNIAQLDVSLIPGDASPCADEKSPLNECNVQDMFATTMAAARSPTSRETGDDDIIAVEVTNRVYVGVCLPH